MPCPYQTDVKINVKMVTYNDDVFVSSKVLVRSAEAVGSVVFSLAGGRILTAMNQTWHVRHTDNAKRHLHSPPCPPTLPIIPRSYRGTFSFLQPPQYDQLGLKAAENEATKQKKTAAKCRPTVVPSLGENAKPFGQR